MRFRFRAFGLHLLASAIALTLVLGTLYLGWYRWPGWYLADVVQVVLVLAGVDLALGPLLTFVIARSSKSRMSSRTANAHDAIATCTSTFASPGRSGQKDSSRQARGCAR